MNKNRYTEKEKKRKRRSKGERNTGDRRLCASGGITHKKNAGMCCGDLEGDASGLEAYDFEPLDMDLKY